MLPDHLRALTNWEGYVALHNLPSFRLEKPKETRVVLSFYEMQKPYGVMMSPAASTYGISAFVSGAVCAPV